LRRGGFSIIELLVVIVIIAILVALTTSGVQQARVAAFRTVCANNLAQMGIAANSFHSIYGRYPPGGWGWGWVGDPDRGPDQNQPGGWIYNILPFTEYQNVHDMGKGLPAAQKQAAISQRVGITIGMFNCPMRRKGGPYPNDWGYTYGEIGGAPPLCARTDYAACIGDNPMDEYFWGPGDEPTGTSTASYTWSGWHNTSTLTGVTFERSMVRQSDITKGISNTYLYGEKYLRADNYQSNLIWEAADNENMYCGMDNDICRDSAAQPHQDQVGVSDSFAFGSAHKLGFNMVFADGSVRFVMYNTAMNIFTPGGNRNGW
jgi:prepilin-type N-terminal cleavage/methylation domain-containing protein/prepilin-type processing-associated H-X9-DG protein